MRAETVRDIRALAELEHRTALQLGLPSDGPDQIAAELTAELMAEIPPPETGCGLDGCDCHLDGPFRSGGGDGVYARNH